MSCSHRSYLPTIFRTGHNFSGDS